MNTMQMCWSDSTGTSMNLIKARSKELRRSAFFSLADDRDRGATWAMGLHRSVPTTTLLATRAHWCSPTTGSGATKMSISQQRVILLSKTEGCFSFGSVLIQDLW